MKDLVRLRTRPSRDGKTFVYTLDYVDEEGKRVRSSLGHADKRKAERQRAQKERELRMGIVQPGSLKLLDYAKDSLERTGDQIRFSTNAEYLSAMKDFISIVGNRDVQQIKLVHAERYRQACLDRGNTPATVSKKLRHLKVLFQLGVKRQQLDENPFRFIQMPRSPKTDIQVYTSEQCLKIYQAAQAVVAGTSQANTLCWDLLIALCLNTGMRRGELLNLTWQDIDFAEQVVTVQPKEDTAQTWEWQVKDGDNRILPLTEQMVSMLTARFEQVGEGNPYVFIPDVRYKAIQQHRAEGQWDLNKTRERLIGNFNRQYVRILNAAKVPVRKFHTLRATALSSLLANGMSEFEVMKIAGHSDFRTTHKYYLAVQDDLVRKTREVTAQKGCLNLARIWHAPHSG